MNSPQPSSLQALSVPYLSNVLDPPLLTPTCLSPKCPTWNNMFLARTMNKLQRYSLVSGSELTLWFKWPEIILLTLVAYVQRGLWYLVCKFVPVSVCYHVFCNYAQLGNEIAIATNRLLPVTTSFEKRRFS